MKNYSRLKWIAEHLTSWRIDINKIGYLEWIDDAGYSIEEVVKLPDNWDGVSEDLTLFSMAVDCAMEG